jgi:hypothetical protein
MKKLFLIDTDTHVVVPMDITKEMQDAGEKEWKCQNIFRIHEAMIAAAPEVKSSTVMDIIDRAEDRFNKGDSFKVALTMALTDLQEETK